MPEKVATGMPEKVANGVAEEQNKKAAKVPEKELCFWLINIGVYLLAPSEDVEEILKHLNKVETLLRGLKQHTSCAVCSALVPIKKGLISNKLFGHVNWAVRVSVLSCIHQLLRLTAPEAPYENNTMKVIFEQTLIVLETHLTLFSGSCYKKALQILETSAKVRSCLILLDIGCEPLVIQMFQLFLDNIRPRHPEAVFTNMEQIMTRLIDESDELSIDLLKPLLTSVKKENQTISQLSGRLGMKVLKNCSSRVKPFLIKAVEQMRLDAENYTNIGASIWPDVFLEDNVTKEIGVHASDLGQMSANGTIGKNNVIEETDLGQMSADGTLGKNHVMQETEVHASNLDKFLVDGALGKNNVMESIVHATELGQMSSADCTLEVMETEVHASDLGQMSAADGTLEVMETEVHASDLGQIPVDGTLDDVIKESEVHASDIGQMSSTGGTLEVMQETEVHATDLGQIPVDGTLGKNNVIKESEVHASDIGQMSSTDGTLEVTQETEVHATDLGQIPVDGTLGKKNVMKEAEVYPSDHGQMSADGTLGKNKDNNCELMGEDLSKALVCYDNNPALQVIANEADQPEAFESEGSSLKRTERGSRSSLEVSRKRKNNEKPGGSPKRLLLGKSSSKSKSFPSDQSSQGRHRSKKVTPRNEVVKYEPDIRNDLIRNLPTIPQDFDAEEPLLRSFKESGVQEYDEKLIGSRVKVWWPSDRQFYTGTVESYDPSRKRHKVVYVDGDVEDLYLNKERWFLLENIAAKKDEDVKPQSSALVPFKVGKEKASQPAKQGNSIGSLSKKKESTTSSSKKRLLKTPPSKCEIMASPSSAQTTLAIKSEVEDVSKKDKTPSKIIRYTRRPKSERASPDSLEFLSDFM